MILKRFQVQVIEPGLKAHLQEVHQPAAWIITAHNLADAWRKFKAQHFGVLGPNPADYDLRFHSLTQEPRP